jgi:uroporphyrin-III C-methyltransferase/precorrin-2 dehydrogenase/sirohydrochlorin ferrochelatase
VVIYMGLSGLAHLCAKLMEHGLPADWPAAIVQHRHPNPASAP